MKRRQMLSLGLLVVLLNLLLWMPGWADSPPLTPVTFTGFTGAGFAPNPAAGQLDSDSWAITGFSDGDLAFGGTQAIPGTDYTRGTHKGGTGTGGIYAFTDVGSSENTILGVQPIGVDFTPGTITFRVQNTTGALIQNLHVAYTIWTFNDTARSSSLNFSYSTDGTNYASVSVLNFATPEALDASPVWVSTAQSTTLAGINLANNGYVYLRWTGDDVSGSGDRDEYGIDDIQVRIDSPTAVSLRTLTAVSRPGILGVALTAAILLSVAAIASARRKGRAGRLASNRLAHEESVAEMENRSENGFHTYGAPRIVHETTLELRAGSPLSIGLDGVELPQ